MRFKGNNVPTRDFKEGTTAFLEKRKAEFKGNQKNIVRPINNIVFHKINQLHLYNYSIKNKLL